MATNKKKVLFTDSMSKVGVALLATRGDVEAIPFPNMSQDEEYRAILKQHGPVHATILGGTRFRKAELDAAGGMEVVARVGVGYDAIDIPAMTAAKVPVMIAGTANSPSVAEHAMSFMLTLARKGPELTRPGQGRPLGPTHSPRHDHHRPVREDACSSSASAASARGRPSAARRWR